MLSYWVERWHHNIFSANEICEGEKSPIIRQLCFGPLETCEYGIDGGNFYFENKELEGIYEGEYYYEILSEEKILDVIKNELKLCEKYAPELTEQVMELLNGICAKFGIKMH